MPQIFHSVVSAYSVVLLNINEWMTLKSAKDRWRAPSSLFKSHTLFRIIPSSAANFHFNVRIFNLAICLHFPVFHIFIHCVLTEPQLTAFRAFQAIRAVHAFSCFTHVFFRRNFKKLKNWEGICQHSTFRYIFQCISVLLCTYWNNL